MGNCNEKEIYNDYDHLLLYLSKHNAIDFKSRLHEMKSLLIERPEKLSLYHFLILYSVHMNNTLSKKFCNAIELNKDKLPNFDKEIKGPKYVVSYIENDTFAYTFSNEINRGQHRSEAYYKYNGITVLQFALILKQSLWDRYKLTYIGLDNVINLFLNFMIDGHTLYNSPLVYPDLEEKLLKRQKGTLSLEAEGTLESKKSLIPRKLSQKSPPSSEKKTNDISLYT